EPKPSAYSSLLSAFSQTCEPSGNTTLLRFPLLVTISFFFELFAAKAFDEVLLFKKINQQEIPTKEAAIMVSNNHFRFEEGIKEKVVTGNGLSSSKASFSAIIPCIRLI